MSHKGTATFIAQRASAVILLPLVIWFIWGVMANAGASAAEARVWLSEPLTAVLFALLIAACAFHMRIGMDEIIDDYIYDGWRPVLKILNLAVACAAAILGFYSAYLLAFAG
jgi:succinate dehydrogenase / fumarate reductase membrane anchor subunit